MYGIFLFQCDCEGDYKEFNDKTRNVKYGGGNQCDNSKAGSQGYDKKPSTDWDEDDFGCYRFIEPAGSRMPDWPLEEKRCGTFAPGTVGPIYQKILLHIKLKITKNFNFVYWKSSIFF